MENLIREDQTISELVGALTIMIQSCAADRAAFANAEMVAGKLVLDAYRFAGISDAEARTPVTRVISLVDSVKYHLAEVSGDMKLIRAELRAASEAVTESEVRRAEAKRKLSI